MTSMYHQPQLSRWAGWKIAAAALVALLLVAVGALAFAAYATEGAPAWSSEKTAARDAAPALSLGVVSGAPGTAVDVPIRLTNAPTMGSATVSLTYDPAVVSVTHVQNGDVPQSTLTWTRDATTGAIVMLLTTSHAAGGAGDHVFAMLTLEAAEGAAGAVSALTLQVRGAATTDGEVANLQAASGTFRNGVPGDVLGDGVVDWMDYERLAAYLVGENVQIIALNADLDEDGAVTFADAMRLHQYLDGARERP